MDTVKYARSLCRDVEFSTEDASRTDFEYLCRTVDAVVKAGATTINIPDTVGYATPMEMADRVRRLKEKVPGLDHAILSMHCHDDLGMSTANTLAGILAGARQAEVTVNGIGERAGERVARRGGDGDQDAQGHLHRTLTTGREHEGDREDEPDGVQADGAADPAEQGDRRDERLRPFSGIHQDGIIKDRSTLRRSSGCRTWE